MNEIPNTQFGCRYWGLEFGIVLASPNASCFGARRNKNAQKDNS
jgi:hypothetical protein